MLCLYIRVVCDWMMIAVRVTVGLRLGTDICQPHKWYCGALMDAREAHANAAMADCFAIIASMTLFTVS